MRIAFAAVSLLPLAATPSLAEQPASLAVVMAQQVMRCWNPPVGTRAPEGTAVKLRMFLDGDGSIAQPPQLSASPEQLAGDPFLLEAAEAGRRAIVACAPYKLPGDRYDQWHDIVINFDSRIAPEQ